MRKTILLLFVVLTASLFAQNKAHNPLIWADVPDMSMMRVGDTYYMSSTTMHFNPGVPIMKSNDLVNWELVNYCYNVLDTLDELTLNNGKSTYGRGTWASSIRYHKGLYYVSTFSQTTGKTYIFTTKDLEKGPWTEHAFKPSFHDHSLVFEDDGRIYMIWGGGKLNLVELNDDLSGVKPNGINHVLIENASAPSATPGRRGGLGAEGSQLFKHDGKYYLFNITWPAGSMRTVVVHRADSLNGTWEGRVAFQDKGVAQGGLIDTPEGNWFAYLFRDNGSVGRIPYLVPVKWVDGWPVFGVDGKVPDELDLPANKSLIPGIVNSDEFSRAKGDRDLPLVWQWNHNPVNNLWSVGQRNGFLRLTTGRVDNDFLLVRNTLTQRTIGPECTGTTSIDVTKMKDGDFAGLSLLQRKYGQVGVKVEKGKKYLVMYSAQSGKPVKMDSVAFKGKTVQLKATCDFNDRKDLAKFYYSLNGKTWKSIGSELKMEYTIPQFIGYRFGLFNYATKTPGGYVDFDFFHITDKI
jgi:beta-xylosidase